MSEFVKGRPPRRAPQYQGLLPVTIHVQPGRAQTFQVISERLVPVWTHWVGTRSLPCTSRDPELCHVDHSSAGRRRWQGWVAVENASRRQVGFLGLTEGALKSCPSLRAEKTLRGFMLTAWRSGNERQSKLLCKMEKPADVNRKLAATPSVEEFLCRLWDIPFGGKLPMGIEGWPFEQESLNFGDVSSDPINADPLKGTIWEGMEDSERVPPGVTEAQDFRARLRKAGVE